MLGRMLGEFDFYDQYFYDTGSNDAGGFGYYSDQLNFDDLYGTDAGGGGGDYIDFLNFDDLYGGGNGSGGTDLYLDYLDYYLGQGYDYDTADQQAWQDAQGGAVQLEGEGQLPVTELPPYIPFDWNIPYQSYLPPLETPPYIPYEPPVPEPPQLPQSPASQQSNLPPACPGGQYHPFPIGHPQQNICVPFPSTQTQQPAKPQPQTGGGSSSGGSSSGSKPQTQQNCASNQCKHPTTGQCITTPQGYYRDPQTQVCRPIPQQQQQTCPAGQYRSPSTGQCRTIPQCGAGTVFDQRTERCIPIGQAQQPACPSGYYPNYDTRRCEKIPACEPGLVFDPNAKQCVLPSQLSPGADGDILSSLKSIPLWLWLAGLGAFLLLGKDNEGRTTTVRYRRAS